jgi:hypothetical protein
VVQESGRPEEQLPEAKFQQDMDWPGRRGPESFGGVSRGLEHSRVLLTFDSRLAVWALESGCRRHAEEYIAMVAGR